MIYAVRKNLFSNEAVVFYKEDDVPKNENFVLKLNNISDAPNSSAILKFNQDFTDVFWEDKEPELFIQEKEKKITDSKLLLKDFLINNPLYSNAHNQVYDYYNVTEEKQTLLTSEFMGYQVMKNAGIETVISWNAINKPCEIWQETEIITLIAEIREYVKPLVAYQQKKELEINGAKTIQELENIKIDYSTVHENLIFKEEESLETNNIDNTNLELVDDLQ